MFLFISVGPFTIYRPSSSSPWQSQVVSINILTKIDQNQLICIGFSDVAKKNLCEIKMYFEQLKFQIVKGSKIVERDLRLT